MLRMMLEVDIIPLVPCVCITVCVEIKRSLILELHYSEYQTIPLDLLIKVIRV